MRSRVGIEGMSPSVLVHMTEHTPTTTTGVHFRY